MKAISEMNFKYKEEEASRNYVLRFSRQMQVSSILFDCNQSILSYSLFPLVQHSREDDILWAPFVFDTFNKQFTSDVLSQLTPQNLM